MLFKQADVKQTTPPIVFIALNIINDRGPWNSNSYKALSAIDKLALLEKGITYACETLKEKELKNELSKESMWVISWREHGVSEANSNYATIQTKALLKAMLDKLTTKYEKLTIIAGTTKTKRHIDAKIQDNILKNIQKRYENLDDVLTLENKAGHNEFKDHKEQFKKVMQQMAQNGFSVVRNTLMVSPGNYHRAKTAAWDEIDKGNQSTEIFYPGRKENIISDLVLRNKNPITVGIEICYEHHLGVLKSTHPKKVFLHLIQSNSTKLRIDHLQGLYNIYIDSKDGVQFISAAGKNDPKLIVYELNMNNLLLWKHAELEGPIQGHDYFAYAISTRMNIPDIEIFVKEYIAVAGIEGISQQLTNLVIVGNETLLLSFLRNGATTNVLNEDMTPLTAAMYFSRPTTRNIIQTLLDHKADPTIKNKKGETPLHIGVSTENLRNVEDLLNLLPVQNLKAFIDLTTNSGKTAAHVAAKSNRAIAILEVLHKHGADLTIKDKKQHSPLDYLAKNTDITEEEKAKFIASLDAKPATSIKPG